MNIRNDISFMLSLISFRNLTLNPSPTGEGLAPSPFGEGVGDEVLCAILQLT